MRRLGEPIDPTRCYRIRPGAYVILPRDGALLLTYQEDPEPEYQLPGGGIDTGESPIPALHREVLEETGWHIARPRRLGAYRRFVYMPEYGLWAEKVCTIYIAHPTLAVGPPIEAGHTGVWMTPDEAVTAMASPGDRTFLQAVKRRLPL